MTKAFASEMHAFRANEGGLPDSKTPVAPGMQGRPLGDVLLLDNPRRRGHVVTAQHHV
jgi:hypothetical protein